MFWFEVFSICRFILLHFHLPQRFYDFYGFLAYFFHSFFPPFICCKCLYACCIEECLCISDYYVLRNLLVARISEKNNHRQMAEMVCVASQEILLCVKCACGCKEYNQIWTMNAKQEYADSKKKQIWVAVKHSFSNALDEQHRRAHTNRETEIAWREEKLKHSIQTSLLSKWTFHLHIFLHIFMRY